jgi:protein kinase-like protein/nuclease-like protein/bacteriophage exclusion system BrxC/D-like protein
MASILDVGPGSVRTRAARAALEALAERLDSSWLIALDVPLPESCGRRYRLDALIVGPGGSLVLECPALGGRIGLGRWEWCLDRGVWVRSPLHLARFKARAMTRAVRSQELWTGRLPVRAAVLLAHPGATVRGSDSLVADGESSSSVLTRATLAHGASQLRVPIAGPPSQVEVLRRVLDAWVQSVPPVPDRVGELFVRAELQVEPRFRVLLGQAGDDAKLRWMRLVPGSGSDEIRGRVEVSEASAWEAAVLAELGRHRGLPVAGAAFVEPGIGLCQTLEPPCGVSLATWVGRHPAAGVAERTTAAAAIARVLAALHRLGLTHGALGPLGVRLEDRPDPGEAWLEGLDLLRGPAPQAVAGEAWDRDEDRFLAPELLLGWGRPGPAADQYGLGIALTLLFEGALRGSCSLDLERPALPGRLGAIVRRLLAPRPVDRFRGVEEAADAIESLERPRPRAPRPLPPAPGPDYEVLDLEHFGSRCAVYRVRHRPGGAILALKVPHEDPAAQRALLNEAQVLARLSHPRLPRCHGTLATPDGRSAVLLDWMPGQALAKLLRRGAAIETDEGRRYGQELLDLLMYLHREGVVHRNIEPSHLVIGDGHLGLIDFSGDDARPRPAYRDPSAATSGSAAQDRYAAALCLFELWAGTHAFRGGVPRPGEDPAIEPELFDGTEGSHLAGFFRRALNPDPELRYASVREMRAALVAAQRFAQRLPAVEAVQALRGLAGATSQSALEGLALGPAAQRALREGGVFTIGALAGLDDGAVERIPAAGRRVRDGLVSVRRALAAAGIRDEEGSTLDLPLLPELSDDVMPIETLDYSPGLQERLAQAGFRGVAGLALCGRFRLRRLPGVGPSGFGRTLRGLAARLAVRRGGLAGPATLDELWSALSSGLDAKERGYLEARYGLLGDEPRTPKTLARSLGLDQAGAGERSLLERLAPEVVVEALAALDRRLLAEEAPVSLEQLGIALEARWPRDGSVAAAALARLLCDLRGAELCDSRRIRGAWAIRSSAEADALLAIGAAAQRMAWEPGLVAAGAARRELADAAAAEGCTFDLGLRDLRHLAEQLRRDEEISAPSAQIPDETVGAPAEEEPISCAEELLAHWIRIGATPEAERLPLEHLVRRYGTDGALLGWVAAGGAPEELVRSGLLQSSNAALPTGLALRGLRRCLSVVKPALGTQELRLRAGLLAARSLERLGRPLQRQLVGRAEQEARLAGVQLDSGRLLASTWRERCARLAARLADGGEAPRGELEELRRHRCRAEQAEELELLEEMSRLARFLAGEPRDVEGLQSLIKHAASHLAWAERCVARIHRALYRTPYHRAEAGRLLERFRQAHDRISERFARTLAAESWPELAARGPAGVVAQSLAPLLARGRALWIVLRSAPLWAVLDWLEDLCKGAPTWGLGSSQLALALEPEIDQAEGVPRGVRRLASQTDLRELAALLQDPGSPLTILDIEDPASRLEQPPAPPMPTPALELSLLGPALRAARAASIPVILSTDGGSTPFWPEGSRLGPGGPARVRDLLKPEAAPLAWIPFPSSNSLDVPVHGRAWAIGAHRGPARAAYRGGVSPAEVLAPVILLEPDGLAPCEPDWWHEPPPDPGSAPEEPIETRGRREVPDEQVGEPVGEVPRVPEPQGAGPEQLVLGLVSSGSGTSVAVPPALDQDEAEALRSVAAAGVLREIELAERVGWPVSRTLGVMARLRARLSARGLELFAVERDPRGVTLFKSVAAPHPSVEEPVLPPLDVQLKDLGAGGSALELTRAAEEQARLRVAALQSDFAVSKVLLPTEPTAAHQVVTQALARIETAGLGQAALADLVAWWMLEAEESGGPDVALAHLNPSVFDLPRLLSHHRRLLDAADPGPAQALVAWMCGSPPAPALRRLGIASPVGNEGLSSILRLVLSMLRQTGHRGWLVTVEAPGGVPAEEGWAAALRDLAGGIQSGWYPGLALSVLASDELVSAGTEGLMELGRRRSGGTPPLPVTDSGTRELHEPARPVELSLFPLDP